MTRPEIPINWEEVDKMLMSGCPGTDISAVLGMHCETFYHRVEKKFKMGFSEYSAKKKASGKSLLRYHQYQKAIGATKKGDTTMLIWLGKQLLGQRENFTENLVAEDVMKAFNDLMAQIDKAKIARQNAQESQEMKTDEKMAQSNPASSSSASNDNCSSQSCRESPFV